MENEKINIIESAILDYLSNSICLSALIEKIGIDPDQESTVSDILTNAQRDWELADCDAEGATVDQDKVLERIIESAINEITEINR